MCNSNVEQQDSQTAKKNLKLWKISGIRDDLLTAHCEEIEERFLDGRAGVIDFCEELITLVLIPVAREDGIGREEDTLDHVEILRLHLRHKLVHEVGPFGRIITVTD